MRALALAALLMLPSASLLAQSAADPSGHWEGWIRWQASDQGPAGDLATEVDLARAGNGFAGAISIPGLNLKDRPLANIAVEGRSVRFQILLSAPGDNTFAGSLASDGQSLAGGLTHKGAILSFSLTRTGEPRIQAPARSSAIGKELEGAWNGTLSVSGKQMRIQLALTNQPDGAATGHLLNLDQGNIEIPIATITQKARSLTLDVKAVGGSYAGELSPETGELAGTWTQGALILPLAFRRAVK